MEFLPFFENGYENCFVEMGDLSIAHNDAVRGVKDERA